MISPRRETGTEGGVEDRALELFVRMQERLAQKCPGWRAGPEDPATVLLELWARTEGDLREELEKVEERSLRNALEALSPDPRGPVAARGVVRFDRPEDVSGEVRQSSSRSEVLRIPSLTRVSVPRRPGAQRIVFETACDSWVNHGSLLRAYATTRAGFQVLPLVHYGGLGQAGAAVSAFEETSNDRMLYIGDRRLDRLRVSERIVLEWQKPSRMGSSPSEFQWEYRSEKGWRRLSVRFEMVEGEVSDSGEAPSQKGSVLRMFVDGPLGDLAEHTLEGARLPWLRAHVPGADSIALGVPDLRVGDISSTVLRCFAFTGSGLEDLSFASTAKELLVAADTQPAFYFGLDAPVPVSFYVDLGVAQESAGFVDANPSPPVLNWEFARGDSWTTLEPGKLRDRSIGMTRSGSVHVELSSEIPRASVFGEELVWLRARWTDGRYVRPPMVRAIYCNAVEVVQGLTLRDQEVLPVGGQWLGWIPLPRFPEGTAHVFDSLVVTEDGRSETRTRALGSVASECGETEFLLRRVRDGGLQIRFEGAEGDRCVPSPESEVRVASLRVSSGELGNLPAGSLTNLEFEGPSFLVEQLGETQGGEGLESEESRIRRAAVGSFAGDRPVSASDYRGLVRTLVPECREVEVRPDPLRSGGVLVELVSAVDASGLSSVELSSLEAYLRDRSVPGTDVRVEQLAVVPAVLEVVLSGEAGCPIPTDPTPGFLEAVGAGLRTLLLSRGGSEKSSLVSTLSPGVVEGAVAETLSAGSEWPDLVFSSACVVADNGVRVPLERAGAEEGGGESGLTLLEHAVLQNGSTLDLSAVTVSYQEPSGGVKEGL